jgi:alkanesulfonate monooxygenase SsuD/methylene tetrahydromethanopterin reductase-like flavin-dependent oxidoreductase (luciferase family)
MLEERGFESLWVAEHSHIPLAGRFNVPASGEFERHYHDVMDPVVTLSAAAASTRRLKLATGVCLAIQRDSIQTAKLVASLHQVSGGRFILGIGGGWNLEEMEDHGTLYETRFKEIARADRGDERDLDQGEAGISRRYHRLPTDDHLAQTSPETAPRLSLAAPSATPPKP